MVYLFRKQALKLCRLFCKSLEEKVWVGPILICLTKEMQHIIFYAHVHACSFSYTDEK